MLIKLSGKKCALLNLDFFEPYNPFTKKDLPRGKWRKLNDQEIRNLKIFTN